MFMLTLRASGEEEADEARGPVLGGGPREERGAREKERVGARRGGAWRGGAHVRAGGREGERNAGEAGKTWASDGARARMGERTEDLGAALHVGGERVALPAGLGHARGAGTGGRDEEQGKLHGVMTETKVPTRQS